MKPPPFAYHDPETLDEALALLAEKENARVLAGGQSLIPMLNFRYVQPDHVVDANRIAALSGIADGNGALRIGAMTRQRDVEFSAAVAARCPLLAEAIRQVGHRQTRNRGTVGGSLAHLDPAAEIPLVACALDATIHVAGAGRARDVAFADFARGFMTPAIEEGEMVTAASFPEAPAGHGASFVEFSRRTGDFAIVAVAVLVALGGDGRIAAARLAVGGMGPVPQRAASGEAALVGEAPTPEAFRAAAEHCAELEAMDDVHAPAAYRRQLATVLARRALATAAERARA